jgi:hypothetical protein
MPEEIFITRSVMVILRAHLASTAYERLVVIPQVSAQSLVVLE